MSALGTGEGKKTLEQLLDEIEAQQDALPAEQSQGEAEATGEAPDNTQPFDMSSAAMLQLAGKLPTLMSALGGTPKSGGKDKPDPQALLYALRPYLSDRRREAVDGMLQFWKIRALLQTLRSE